MTKWREREIVDIEIDGVDSGDYPKFCDAYVSGAVWGDTMEDLTEDELDEFTDDNYELVNEMAFESLIME